ncbi:MAG: acetate--CoA ligase family protein [Thermodesulfobacteriota bacterium]
MFDQSAVQTLERPDKLIRQLDEIFNPGSVAVVGVPRGFKMGKLFLIALLEQGFKGPIYPVNPEAQEIDGIRCYPTVAAIPEQVDLAIVLVPHHQALDVVKDCAAKRVKGAVLFTAGYKETGTEQGRALEEELVRIAQGAGMRLFGPNCMGLYCPRSGLSFFPGLSQTPGPVALISHSGSLANILGRIADQKGIRFSKAVSLGNESDLNAAHFLSYLAHDPDTGLIGAYLEGVKDGPFFAQALREAASRKPVILWKTGLTPEGTRAATSHTGALASSPKIWDALVRQTGAIPVVGFERLVDSLMGFSMLPASLGDRVAILSGPGGLAVAAAEACGAVGLKLADLSPQSRETLAQFVAPTGTSLSNPVDVGLTASFEIEIYIQAAKTVAADPGVDAVVIVGAGISPDTNKAYTESLIQARKDSGKPFLMVSIPGFDPALARTFCQNGVPFFDSAERAMLVYAACRQYQLKSRSCV